MKLTILIINLFLYSSFGNAQNYDSPRLVGGPCEGCEAVIEFGNKELVPVDTLPGFAESDNKIKITGIIYQQDRKTPAKDVILYIYHTNEEGIYKANSGETGWGRRHGSTRGWIKTDSDGRYSFYTYKAGAYPNGGIAAHIHPVILEPDEKYYYIEDYYFEGDKFLTEKEINPINPRGGTSGVLTLTENGNLWIGERDIILGENVPGYEKEE